MITRLLGLVHIFRCGGGAKYIWESRPPGLPRAPRTPQPLERTGIPKSGMQSTSLACPDFVAK